MAKPRFYWKSTCSTCRDARSFILNDLGVEVEERNYAKEPLGLDELKAIFKGADPRDYMNPKSPAFKAMGLKGKPLTQTQALELMAQEPNLIKRPVTVAGKKIIAGFDRDALREALKG
ncbi:MAG TPA: ArsC/Spx/MgsR family protein [Candidatus Binataceae bacterium]|nr:ArsC/Spx/MgsR family protein [Candidatus Binataceae bacterium]